MDLKLLPVKLNIKFSDLDLVELNKEFKGLEKQYWEAWTEILTRMAETGTAFEININSFRPGKSFYQKLLAMAGSTEGLMFSLVTDFHNPAQYNNEKPDDLHAGDLFNLPKSRNTRNAIRKLLATIRLMNASGINPDRVVNSSPDRFAAFLARRKSH